MRVLLAIGNEDFSSILRKYLIEDLGFDVIESDAYHRNFLPELLDIERPDIIILHDVFLPSETPTQKENELELLQMISTWRVNYDDSLRVVVLSERERNDPFLKSLVAHNVLDIFSARRINVEILMNQLAEPPRFANVSKFGVGDLIDLPTNESEEIIEDDSVLVETTEIDIDEDDKPTSKSLMKKLSSVSSRVQSYVRKQRTEDDSAENDSVSEMVEQDAVDVMPKDEIDEPDVPLMSRSQRKTSRNTKKRINHEDSYISQPSNIVYRDRLVGHVTIAVTSIGANVGATHTSLQLASFLKRKGNSVAIVEAARSGDFNRIKELFDENEQNHENPFYVEDIPHYPYIEGENQIPYLSNFQFLILDLGPYESSPLLSEFFRASHRLLVASGSDWKLSLIGKFINKHGKVPFQVVVPFADKELISDLSDIYGEVTSFYATPFHQNPYKENSETDRVFEILYKDFLTVAATSKNVNRIKKLAWFSSAFAICCLLILLYMLLLR